MVAAVAVVAAVVVAVAAVVEPAAVAGPALGREVAAAGCFVLDPC